jgi:hypothetical protein
MPQNNPDNFPLLTWVWVLGMSIFGSIVRTITMQNEPLAGWRLVRRLTANAVVSVFIAIITAALCVWADIPFWLMVVFIGLTSHMGAPVLLLAEDKFIQYVKSKKIGDQ